MYGIEFIQEVERIYGNKLTPEQGVIVIDLGVYFPYMNQEIVSTDVHLYKEIPDDFIANYNVPNNKGTKDTVMNHRYPNQGYVTLSKKNGRKICKFGTFIVDTLENMNEYKYLSIEVRIGSEISVSIIPVSIQLTKDNPCASIEIHDINAKLGLGTTICTNKPINKGYWECFWHCTNKRHYEDLLNKGIRNVSLLTVEMKFNKDPVTMYFYDEVVTLHENTFDNIVV